MPGTAWPPISREQGCSYRESGLQNGPKIHQGGICTYAAVIYPHPALCPVLKRNTDFLCPETELLEVHLAQAELNKIYPLDFILLCPKLHSNWLSMSPAT